MNRLDDPGVVAVDVGRSGTRAVVASSAPDDPGRRSWVGHGAGIGDRGGPAAVAAVVRSAVPDSPPHAGWSLAVCVPGALTHPDLAAALAGLLVPGWRRDPGTVVVTSDIVAWHTGAFPRPAEPAVGAQVVLAVGTGAVALGVATDGTVKRVDGHGLLFGDDGGGARLGQEGLRAALRALDGTGPPTALAEAARPALAERPATAAGLAAFAPAVLAAAADGDPVAVGIVDDAVAALGCSVVAAAGRSASPLVAVVGGLAEELRPRLTTARPDLVLVTPEGDATDGLRRLARDRGTVHEPTVVHRSRPHRRERSAQPPAAVPAQHADHADDVDHLVTEAVRTGSERLDTLAPAELVALLVDGQAMAPAAVAAAVGPLTRAVEALSACLRRGGRLVYAGAGTSGRLAVQDAAELSPTFGLDPDRARALLAGGVEASGAAVENAEDDRDAGHAAVTALGVGADDVVVGVAASGRTPYVRGALAAAAARGAVTVAVVNSVGGPLASDAEIAVELATGPEVLAGSTRLTAGTAQKIALNTLTTAAMVRSGATYGPWMVGVQGTNAKLRRRAGRIVQEATGVDEATAAATLAATGGDVAPALVALLAGVDTTTAARRLAAAGSVRAAVEDQAHPSGTGPSGTDPSGPDPSGPDPRGQDMADEDRAETA